MGFGIDVGMVGVGDHGTSIDIRANFCSGAGVADCCEDGMMLLVKNKAAVCEGVGVSACVISKHRQRHASDSKP